MERDHVKDLLFYIHMGLYDICCLFRGIIRQADIQIYRQTDKQAEGLESLKLP